MIERQRPLLILTAALLCFAAGCAGPNKNKRSSAASLPSHPGAAEPAPEPTPEPAAEAPAPAPKRREPAALPRKEAQDGYAFNHTVLALFGQRMLDDADWEPTDEITMGGLNYMGRGPGGWLHWDFAVTFGDDTETALINDELFDLSAKVWEVDLGLAAIVDIGILRPYVGAGLAVVNIDAEVEQNGASFSDDSTTVGGYGRAGLSLEVTKTGGLVGVEVRYLVGTDVNIAGVDTDVDGLQAMVNFGWCW